MKSLAISIILAALSPAAFAAESTVYRCIPGNELNGLAISQLILDASNEDPEAEMKVGFQGREKLQVSNMAYDGSFPNLHFFPNAERDGKLSVQFQRRFGALTATVTHENIDTISVLVCRQQR